MTNDLKPAFAGAQGILTLPYPLMPDPARDEQFIAAIKPEFPSLVHRTLSSEVPPDAPYLVVASTSSRLALSATQADFQVRFYGEYESDLDKTLAYIERKLHCLMSAFDSVRATPTTAGVVLTSHYSWKGREHGTPAEHLTATHLKAGFPADALQDVFVRASLRSGDRFFVNLSLSNYESRMLQRPMMPGMNLVRVKPWEGTLEDEGVEMIVDVNNNLQAKLTESDPELTMQDVTDIIEVVRQAVNLGSTGYVESGVLSELPAVETQAAGGA